MSMYILDKDEFKLDKFINCQFRCGNGCNLPVKTPQGENRKTVDEILVGVAQMTCLQTWSSSTRELDDGVGESIT